VLIHRVLFYDITSVRRKQVLSYRHQVSSDGVPKTWKILVIWSISGRKQEKELICTLYLCMACLMKIEQYLVLAIAIV